MSQNEELFDTTAYIRPTAAESERRLFYVTNATNLRGILASGLLRPMTGWPKYAPDLQESAAGCIPLYCGEAPRAGIEAVTRHDKHDQAVVLEFDATGWDGEALTALDGEGRITETTFARIPSTARVLLIRGVVPLADLKTMYVRGAEEAKRVESDCRAMANTRPDLVPITHGFDAIADGSAILPQAEDLTPPDPNKYGMEAMRRLDAVGGALGALLRMRESGGRHLLRRILTEWTPAWEDDADAAPDLPEVLAGAVAAWAENVEQPDTDPEATFLRLALNWLASRPFGVGLSPEGFLDALDAAAEKGPLARREELCRHLAAIRASALQDQDPSRVFQATGSSVLRGILLFLLDDAYRPERRLPDQCGAAADLLVAEILRGALHGWTRVPVALRGAPSAELAVGYAMARLAGARPGSLQFPRRSFAWVDEEALVARMLTEVIRGMADLTSREHLRQYATSQGASSIEIRIRVKAGGRKADAPAIARTVKGRKTKKLAIDLDLPYP